jgi:hypothetical protein
MEAITASCFGSSVILVYLYNRAGSKLFAPLTEFNLSVASAMRLLHVFCQFGRQIKCLILVHIHNDRA